MLVSLYKWRNSLGFLWVRDYRSCQGKQGRGRRFLLSKLFFSWFFTSLTWKKNCSSCFLSVEKGEGKNNMCLGCWWWAVLVMLLCSNFRNLKRILFFASSCSLNKANELQGSVGELAVFKQYSKCGSQVMGRSRNWNVMQAMTWSLCAAERCWCQRWVSTSHQHQLTHFLALSCLRTKHSGDSPPQISWELLDSSLPVPPFKTSYILIPSVYSWRPENSEQLKVWLKWWTRRFTSWFLSAYHRHFAMQIKPSKRKHKSGLFQSMFIFSPPYSSSPICTTSRDLLHLPLFFFDRLLFFWNTGKKSSTSSHLFFLD